MSNRENLWLIEGLAEHIGLSFSVCPGNGHHTYWTWMIVDRRNYTKKLVCYKKAKVQMLWFHTFVYEYRKVYPSFYFISFSLIKVDVCNEHWKKLRTNVKWLCSTRMFELYIFNSSSSGIFQIARYSASYCSLYIWEQPLVNFWWKRQVRTLSKLHNFRHYKEKTLLMTLYSHVDYHSERG